MNPILTLTRKWVAAAVLLVVFSVCALAQTNLPPTWVFARSYNGWSILGQQANTYTFNGGACNFAPSTNGNSPSFFVFSGTQGGSTVYFPVLITDSDPTKSEIVTPSSTSQGSGSCGFAATTSNTHTSFALTSGTAGLQEAVATQFQSSPVFDVILDKAWYQTVAAFPSGSAQSIIAAVTGNANVGIVDTTTVPWTTYSWNGTKYAANSSTGGVPFTSVTQVAAATALSTGAASLGLITTATTGGTIPASSTYRLGATCVTPLGGETSLSIDTASTATIATGAGTATNTISVTSPAGCTAANGAVGWRLYMSAASGASLSEILYAPTCTGSTGQIVLAGVCAIGSSATITAVITGTATIPAINSAFQTAGGSTSPSQSIVSYPPFPNLATIAAAATGTLAEVNFYPGFLNTLGRHLRVRGTGFGVTNGTPGTLTVATTLASIPGVTSVTPFTAVSGTTTASATVNFEFDVDVTTAATGATGTVEAHGVVRYNLAGTAVSTSAQDLIIAVSSTVDLTKQDQLAITLKPTTTAITTGGAQVRQMTLEVVQ